MSEVSETDQPTVSVIGYGSLLSPNEILPFLDKNFVCATPVRIEGFRRTFNQESTWRAKATDAEAKAVLNAVIDEEYSMNGIFLPNLSQHEYTVLRDRERGYRMVEVEPEYIEPYFSKEDDEDFPESDIVLVPTGKRVSEGIRPVPEYIDICLDGARYWGDEFYHDFLRTTEAQPDVTLKEYLDRRSH